MNKKVIVIIGPTASGKSSIGIELAKKINGVVISADSMQIYKGLDIGTAKVTDEESEGIKHELINIVDVNDKFSVSDYKDMCYAKIREVLDLGKVPIIVGGTGLYINAVVNNMSFDEADLEKETEVQEKFEKLTNGKSSEELYDILKNLDEEATKNIDMGNDKRVLRAIKLSLVGVKKSNIDNRNDLWHKNDSEFEFLNFYIDIPRDLLYDRINMRVDQMVQLGVLHEAKWLYDLCRNEKLQEITALQAIGYKEFFEYFDGTRTLEECIELLKQKTRNYAKRQITWFKKLEPKILIDGTDSKKNILNKILEEYYG